MDTLSGSWIPGITGRHLPVHIVSRCFAKPSCSRSNGSLNPTKLSAYAIGKNSKPPLTMSIFLVGEAPFCRFLLPRFVRDRHLGTTSAKRRLCRTSTGRPLPVIRLTLSSDEEDQQARQENSAERELGSSFSQSAPFDTEPFFDSDWMEGRFLKWIPDLEEEYERKVIHGEMVSRGKAVEAAAEGENHWGPMIFEPDRETLRSAPSTDMLGNSLAVEDEKLKGGRPLREARKQQRQLEHAYNQRKKETRRSVLQHCLPPFLDRIGFQFPPKISPDRQSHQQAASNVTVAYSMSYVRERTADGWDRAEESAIDVLNQYGIQDWHSNRYYPRKAASFARSMDCRMSSRETIGVKMGTTKSQRVHQMGLGHSTSHFGGSRSGRVLDPSSHLYSGRGRTLRHKARFPVSPQDGTARRLWLRAESGVESAGNLFKDWLTIVGLVAFVVSGTYAFAMSQQYFKSGNLFRKMPSGSVTVANSAPESQPKPPMSNQTSVAEVTDENFVDTIQKRPTFMLFYASWCPYCQKLDPIWNALGEILSKKGYDVQLARMNAETHPKTAKNFKVVKYPTLIFFKGGVAADNYLGPRSVNDLMEFIEVNLRSQC